MTATQRVLAVEAAIYIVPNALVSALFVWLLFRSVDAVPLWGMQGVAFDLVPTTFMLTLMTTIGLTLVVRARTRKGAVHAADAGFPALPHNVVARALVLALTATVMLVPVSVIVLHLLWAGNWSYDTIMIFKVGYGVAVGLVVTSIVVLAAMRDG